MNLQARGASRKKTRTHVYKHTRAEKEAHKTHHAFLWSFFDPFTLTKLYLHLIGKENINTWQWKRSNKMDSEEWEKKRYSLIHILTHQRHHQTIYLPSMTWATRFWLMIENKMNRPRFLSFLCMPSKRSGILYDFANCKSMIIAERRKNWVLDRLIKHAKQKKTYAHTSSRDTTRVREWKKKKKIWKCWC